MTGTTLSHYRIDAELGRGGMGVVYKGFDTKLDRTVAIKVLPAEALTNDEDRARFYREAKAAAQLHHPHIASVFEIDEAVPSDAPAGARPRPFIAMEYIDGESLSERIERGPLKLEEAVHLASQIAEALEAAHEKDIVHRDIKSGNVMLTAKGKAKVLDFGLAKTKNSTMLTSMGSTLGTIAYMSPEQARGDEVDGRTDLWSLGVGLYEMIAGRLPFRTEYEQAAVYSILNEEAEPLTSLRTGVPMDLEWIVSKLMAKDADRRYRSAGDVIVDLNNIDLSVSGVSRISTTSQATAATRPAKLRMQERSVPIILTAVIAIAALAAGVLIPLSGSEQVAAPLRKFEFPAENVTSGGISPDGTHLAYIQDGTLWVRDFEAIAPVDIANAPGMNSPFWSPDGANLAYFIGTELWRIGVSGGQPTRIGEFPISEGYFGRLWRRNGTILVSVVYGGSSGEIYSVASSGGTPTVFLRTDWDGGEAHFRGLVELPDTDHVLARVAYHDHRWRIRVITDPGRSPIYEGDIPNSGKNDLVFSRSGYLVFDDFDGIWALPFSTSLLTSTGEKRLVAPRGSDSPSVSIDETLVYRSPDARTDQVVEIDRDGKVMHRYGSDHFNLTSPVWSPDERLVVTTKLYSRAWLQDVRGPSTRLTDDHTAYYGLDWSVLGNTIFMASFVTGRGDLYTMLPRVDAEPQFLYGSENPEFGVSLSGDGSHIVFYSIDRETKRDLWYVQLEFENQIFRTTGEAVELLRTPYEEASPKFHPDRALIGYQSTSSGQWEVRVRSFPDGDWDMQISIGGGTNPDWSPTGTELFYMKADTLM
ncbi:MAG: serine/threonine-protein kinase, partial [Bacteroidetes bacterium]|nr:serine/threonine-protein kinase [Bacteroidota bacterium]